MASQGTWTWKEASGGVVALSGEIDFTSSPEVKKRFREWIARSEGPLRLDLGGLAYLDSSGLAVLIEARRLLKAADRGIEVLALTPQVEKIFRLTQVGTLFGLDEGS